MDSMTLIQAIQAFRDDYRQRYGTWSDSLPSDVGQLLGQAKAHQQALSLLLNVDFEKLQIILNRLIYETDLSESALAEARKALGIYDRKTLGQLQEVLDPYDLKEVDPETKPRPSHSRSARTVDRQER